MEAMFVQTFQNRLTFIPSPLFSTLEDIFFINSMIDSKSAYFMKILLNIQMVIALKPIIVGKSVNKKLRFYDGLKM